MNEKVLPDIHDIKKEIFYKIWKLIDDKYVLFEEKNVNWNSTRLYYENSLDLIESYKGLYEYLDQMLLELRDPHTRIVFSPHNNDTGIMPIILNYIHGDYYIYKNLGEGELLTGMRLLSIDDVPIKEVESRFRDKFMFTSKSARTNSFFKEFSSGNLGHCLKIKAVSDSGKEVESEIYFQTVDRNVLDTPSAERMKALFSFCQMREFDDNIGYIKILNFRSKKVVTDFLEAALKFYTKESMVIDIRGNDGGLIEAATDVSALLLKHEMRIGYKVERKAGGKHNEFERPTEVIIKSSNYLPHYKKIVILCDEFTMSSAEFIFLRALKDSDDRITVVGNKTGGLAHGASIFTLFDGTKVQITTLKYLNKRGNILAEEGITPNIEIHNNELILTQNNDNQLNYAIKLCNS